MMSVYSGESGASYFGWQRRAGEIDAALNARHFASEIQPSDTVIDFGCGSGALLAALDCNSRIGVEVNEHATAVARGRGVDVRRALRDFPDCIADVAISNTALEHVLNPFVELCEIHRVLRPGGKLVFCVPCDDWKGERRRPEGRDHSRDVNHHLYSWTPLLFRNLLGEAGFEVDRIWIDREAWPPGTKYLYRLPRRIFHALAITFGVFARIQHVRVVAHRS